jgi:hypothetical protein
LSGLNESAGFLQHFSLNASQSRAWRFQRLSSDFVQSPHPSLVADAMSHEMSPATNIV